MTRVSEGRRTAIGHLICLYEPLLEKWIRLYLGRERFARDGEDLLQTIRLAPVKDLPGLEQRNRRALLAWLRKFVRTQSIDWERARHAGRRDPGRPVVRVDEARFPGIPSGGDSPSRALIRKEDLEELRQAIERVPERYRGVLEFIHDRNPAPAEVVAYTGKPPEAARKFVARALDHLRASLRRSGAPAPRPNDRRGCLRA